MGKQRTPSLFAGTPTQPEPADSWMSELRLQAVTLDTARWSPAPQPTLWRKPKDRARPLRLH